MQGNNYVSEDQISISKNYEFNKQDGLKVKYSHNKAIETENHVLSNDHSAVLLQQKWTNHVLKKLEKKSC